MIAMTLDDFDRLHRSTGYAIKKTGNQYFLKHQRINYSFPLLAEIPVSRQLVDHLKWRHPVTVIKTSAPVKNTYEYILKTENYGIGTFRKRTRTTIRKCLKNCEIKRPTLEDLIHTGLQINRQTLHRQRRTDKFLTQEKRWKKYASLLYHQKDTTILGAYLGSRMIAFAVAYQLQGKHCFYIQHIDRNYSTYYPMSGLIYELVNKILDAYGRIEISDGIESFHSTPSLNRFKRYMQFERQPITRVYVLHPFLVPAVHFMAFFWLRILRKRNVKHPFVRKAIDLYYGYRLLSRMLPRTGTESCEYNEKEAAGIPVVEQ